METFVKMHCLKFLIILSGICGFVSQHVEGGEGHGLVQLRKFVSDRPVAQIVQTKQGPVSIDLKSDLFTEIAKLFKLRDGKLIVWSSDPPEKELEYIADHTIPTKKQIGEVRVRGNYKDKKGVHEADFEALWYALIFELLNIQNHEKFITVYNMALEEEISKEEWVRQNAMIEYDALKRIREFYVKHWKPWMEKKNADQKFTAWGVAEDRDFQDWFTAIRKENRYRYWDGYYEKHIDKYYKRIKIDREYSTPNEHHVPTNSEGHKKSLKSKSEQHRDD